MNSNEPIYELSADSGFAAHEAFFNQRFVGKQLDYNPHAPTRRQARVSRKPRSRHSRTQKETWGAQTRKTQPTRPTRQLPTNAHAPHTPIRARRAQHRALKAR